MKSLITAVQKIQEVSALLEVPNSRIIAGGTGFSPEKEGLHLIDISGLESLSGIKQKGNRIEIGPLTTLENLAGSAILKKYAPALAEAAASVTDETVRVRGTLGGNLAGERIGDMAAALLSTGAKLTIKTGTDFREILIDRFWTSDGKNDLQYDEWITRITLQIPKEPLWGAAFGKIGTWEQDAEPSAAAALRMSVDEKRKIIGIRGGLRKGKDSLQRMFPLEKALKNQPAGEPVFSKAAAAMTAALKENTGRADLSALLMDLLQRSFAMAEEMRKP